MKIRGGLVARFRSISLGTQAEQWSDFFDKQRFPAFTVQIPE